MVDTQVYQIAFQFQFQADISNVTAEIDITDANRFVVADNEKFQITPYQGSSTPPLANVSVGSKSLFLNIASGKAYAGVQGIIWSTFTGGGLNVNLNVNGSLIAVYYSFLGGSGGAGTLQPGANQISPGVGVRHHG